MMDEQALFDEMMSQPLTEDEREMVSDHLMQQAILQRDERIAALEAELSPWRQMARQVEALREKGYVIQLAFESKWGLILRDHVNYSYVCEGHGYDSPPDAVNAAYGKVVGDE